MNAVIGDDPSDTTITDREVALAQLLADHLGRGLRVQEAVAQHLPDHLIGAAVVTLGAALFGGQSGHSASLVLLKNLIIALATVAETGRHGADITFEALAGEEHGEVNGLHIGDSEG